MLEHVDYWEALQGSPSQMETLFAIFANVLELDEHGEPFNEKYAERRAATWLYQYCTTSRQASATSSAGRSSYIEQPDDLAILRAAPR
jgi:hypothetical protein